MITSTSQDLIGERIKQHNRGRVLQAQARGLWTGLVSESKTRRQMSCQDGLSWARSYPPRGSHESSLLQCGLLFGLLLFPMPQQPSPALITVPWWEEGRWQGWRELRRTRHAHGDAQSDGGNRAQLCSWSIQFVQTHSVLGAPRLVSGEMQSCPKGSKFG